MTVHKNVWSRLQNLETFYGRLTALLRSTPFGGWPLTPQIRNLDTSPGRVSTSRNLLVNGLVNGLGNDLVNGLVNDLVQLLVNGRNPKSPCKRSSPFPAKFSTSPAPTITLFLSLPTALPRFRTHSGRQITLLIGAKQLLFWYNNSGELFTELRQEKRKLLFHRSLRGLLLVKLCFHQRDLSLDHRHRNL